MILSKIVLRAPSPTVRHALLTEATHIIEAKDGLITATPHGAGPTLVWAYEHMAEGILKKHVPVDAQTDPAPAPKVIPPPLTEDQDRKLLINILTEDVEEEDVAPVRSELPTLNEVQISQALSCAAKPVPVIDDEPVFVPPTDPPPPVPPVANTGEYKYVGTVNKNAKKNKYGKR